MGEIPQSSATNPLYVGLHSQVYGPSLVVSVDRQRHVQNLLRNLRQLPGNIRDLLVQQDGAGNTTENIRNSTGQLDSGVDLSESIRAGQQNRAVDAPGNSWRMAAQLDSRVDEESLKNAEFILANLHESFINEDTGSFFVQVEGVDIPCHKMVLAASSPVRAEKIMGSTGLDHSPGGSVSLMLGSSRAMVSLLMYVYSGELWLHPDQVFDVLDLALCYEYSSVIQICLAYIMRVKYPGCAVEFYHKAQALAAKYNRPETKNLMTALKFWILTDFMEVIQIKHSVWELTKEDWEEFLPACNSNDREKIVKAAVVWYQHPRKNNEAAAANDDDDDASAADENDDDADNDDDDDADGAAAAEDDVAVENDEDKAETLIAILHKLTSSSGQQEESGIFMEERTDEQNQAAIQLLEENCNGIPLEALPEHRRIFLEERTHAQNLQMTIEIDEQVKNRYSACVKALEKDLKNLLKRGNKLTKTYEEKKTRHTTMLAEMRDDQRRQKVEKEEIQKKDRDLREDRQRQELEQGFIQTKERDLTERSKIVDEQHIELAKREQDIERKWAENNTRCDRIREKNEQMNDEEQQQSERKSQLDTEEGELEKRSRQQEQELHKIECREQENEKRNQHLTDQEAKMDALQNQLANRTQTLADNEEKLRNEQLQYEEHKKELGAETQDLARQQEEFANKRDDMRRQKEEMDVEQKEQEERRKQLATDDGFLQIVQKAKEADLSRRNQSMCSKLFRFLCMCLVLCVVFALFLLCACNTDAICTWVYDVTLLHHW